MKALVIPADLGKDPREIDWPIGDTIELLHKEMDSHTADIVRLNGLGLWHDGEFLYREDQAFNPRAAWLSALGEMPTAFMGTVVVTQDATDEDGNTLGLDAAWLGIARKGLAYMPEPLL